MVDWVKRFTKHGGAWLEADEAYLGGVALQSSGTMTRMAIGGGIGGAVGAAVGTKLASGADAKLGEQVGELVPADLTVPANGLAVGVTSRRVLLCTQGLNGKPKEVLRTEPAPGLVVQVLDRSAMKMVKTRAYVLRFADGTALTAETPSIGPAAKLADRFEEALLQAGATVERVDA